ncbi:MAG: replicative DNA helicase [Bacteroidales bacterium]
MEKREQNNRNQNSQHARNTESQMSTLPSCLDIEKSILGEMMKNREMALRTIETLSPEMFYIESHQMIFSAIAKLIADAAPVDFICVCELLNREGNLSKVGGPHYITQLISIHITLDRYEYYIEVITEKYFMREAYYRLGELSQKALNEELSSDELLLELNREMNLLSSISLANRSEVNWKDAIAASLEDYDRRKELAAIGKIPGIVSGIPKLDVLTGGFQPGESVVLCARPSMGKTAFAMHLAQAMAKAGEKVAIFSLEMLNLQLANRAIIGEADVDATLFKLATLNEMEELLMREAAEDIKELPIVINDSSSINIAQIHARCAALKREGKCSVVFIDYLQLIGRSSDKSSNREQEISQISRAIKLMAQELRICVVVLSQLNRQAEGRADKMPQLHDLRESGSIEQDADIVIGLHREEYYAPTEMNKGMGSAIILKNRNGKTGTVMFMHNSSMTKIKGA